MTRNPRTSAPSRSIRRLPLYLADLRRFHEAGEEWASTTRLAEGRGLDPTQVRKDLALTGASGQRKLGYRVAPLITYIEEFLGWHRERDAFLVGAGHLGCALLGFQPPSRPGVKIVAAFDADPEKVGRVVRDRQVLALDKLIDLARRMEVRVGIIATPDAGAQDVADHLVAGGIRAIWNFSTVTLDVPANIVVENVDLRGSLALLCTHLQETLAAEGEVVIVED